MFSSVKNANQFCDFLRTVLDKHAPPSLRKVITHSSSPWFESIRDELFIAKRERHQAERKWRNTKLTIFKDLYRQAKHKVSKLAKLRHAGNVYKLVQPIVPVRCCNYECDKTNKQRIYGHTSVAKSFDVL